MFCLFFVFNGNSTGEVVLPSMESIRRRKRKKLEEEERRNKKVSPLFSYRLIQMIFFFSFYFLFYSISINNARWKQNWWIHQRQLEEMWSFDDNFDADADSIASCSSWISPMIGIIQALIIWILTFVFRHFRNVCISIMAIAGFESVQNNRMALGLCPC